MAQPQNPHSVACPDFASETFAPRREDLLARGMDQAQAVAFLRAAWEDVSAQQKAAWDAAVAAGEAASAAAERERLDAVTCRRGRTGTGAAAPRKGRTPEEQGEVLTAFVGARSQWRSHHFPRRPSWRSC